MQLHAIAGDLGPQQTVAAQGPDGPNIKRFACTICDQQHYDMYHYFYGIDSIKCMWCLKYNKKRPIAKTTETNGEHDAG